MAEDSLPPRPQTRNEARELGAVRYFTGKSCKRGHVAERHTSSATCIECDREHYQTRAPTRCLTMRKWRLENPEAMRAANQRWRAANLEYIAAYRRGDDRRRENHTFRLSTYPVDFLLQLFGKQNGKCAGCGIDLGSYEIDHIEPRARGGTNDQANLQLLCPDCNRRKHARSPLEWAQQQKLLGSTSSSPQSSNPSLSPRSVT